MLVAVNLSRARRCKVSNFLDSTLFVYANVLPNLLSSEDSWDLLLNQIQTNKLN